MPKNDYKIGVIQKLCTYYLGTVTVKKKKEVLVTLGYPAVD